MRATVEIQPDGAEWRVVAICPDYEISEFGHLRRCKPNRYGILDTKILAPSNRREGWYDAYALYGNEGRKRTSAHRLVAEAFIGPPPSDVAQVRHLDGNKRNNHYSNLKWGTAAENQADRVIHGTDMRGEQHTNSKLNDAQVREIRLLASSGIFHKDIAPRFNVSRQSINDVVSRKLWAHVA